MIIRSFVASHCLYMFRVSKFYSRVVRGSRGSKSTRRFRGAPATLQIANNLLVKRGVEQRRNVP
jgi:hypothetical protein